MSYQQGQMILDPKTVAEGWIDLRVSKLNKKERALGEWASEALREAIYNDAEYALGIIELIHDLDSNRECAEELAAGPLESLLAYQGAAVIDQIEQKAKGDKSFATLLGGVWQNAMPLVIWERVQQCRRFDGRDKD